MLIQFNNIELTADREVEEWGDCLPDCPTQDTNPVCLMEPVAPALQDSLYPGSKNYSTDFIFGAGIVTKGVMLQLLLIGSKYNNIIAYFLKLNILR